MNNAALNQLVGVGLGLRAQHYSDITEGRPRVQWFEIISDNYMIGGGRPKFFLEKIRRDFPIACHGVSLSIGSANSLDKEYLKNLKKLIEEIEPFLVSDHLCWSGIDGENLHDLLPLPYRRDVVEYVATRIRQVQDFLKRQIIIENVSSYMTFTTSEMMEWEFVTEIIKKSGCGLLLDVNNVYVSSVNHGFDAQEYLNGIPVDSVRQIHLAGHAENKISKGRFLVDSHGAPVCKNVWELYEKALLRFGHVPTMIERDENIPSYLELEDEALVASDIMQRVLEYDQSSKRASKNSKTNSLLDSRR